MTHKLKAADMWTPIAKEDAYLARTITDISLIPEGEIVTYWFGGESGETGQCTGNSFRSWITKMKAVQSVDNVWIDLLSEEYES